MNEVIREIKSLVGHIEKKLNDPEVGIGRTRELETKILDRVIEIIRPVLSEVCVPVKHLPGRTFCMCAQSNNELRELVLRDDGMLFDVFRHAGRLTLSDVSASEVIDDWDLEPILVRIRDALVDTARRDTNQKFIEKLRSALDALQ